MRPPRAADPQRHPYRHPYRMTHHPVDASRDVPHPSSRLRSEFITGSILLAFGLFLMPALVFWSGSFLLGTYGPGTGSGIGTFYGDFYGDLAQGSLRAWALTVGPLVLVQLVRLIFLRRPTDDGSPPDGIASRQSRPPAPSDQRRVEPRVSLD